jgi:hypothetical protein
MKISNMLTMPKANKLGPIFKLDWLPANLLTLASAAIVLTTIVIVLQINKEANAPENKSLAWYMANPKEALTINKVCFDNPQLKATENCVNSLHALEIIHKGPNS